MVDIKTRRKRKMALKLFYIVFVLLSHIGKYARNKDEITSVIDEIKNVLK